MRLACNYGVSLAPRRSSCTAQQPVSVQASFSSVRVFWEHGRGLAGRALSSRFNLVLLRVTDSGHMLTIFEMYVNVIGHSP